MSNKTYKAGTLVVSIGLDKCQPFKVQM